jgi:hypothetical protein
MVFNATFNNISIISWQSVLLVEEIGVTGEKPPSRMLILYHSWKKICQFSLNILYLPNIEKMDYIQVNLTYEVFSIESFTHNNLDRYVLYAILIPRYTLSDSWITYNIYVYIFVTWMHFFPLIFLWFAYQHVSNS